MVLVTGETLVVGPTIGKGVAGHDVTCSHHARVYHRLAVVGEANGTVVGHFEEAVSANKPPRTLASLNREGAGVRLARLTQDGTMAELERSPPSAHERGFVNVGWIDALRELRQGFLDLVFQSVDILSQRLSTALNVACRLSGIDVVFELFEVGEDRLYLGVE